MTLDVAATIDGGAGASRIFWDAEFTFADNA
jgi:hypothetical protein